MAFSISTSGALSMAPKAESFVQFNLNGFGFGAGVSSSSFPFSSKSLEKEKKEKGKSTQLRILCGSFKQDRWEGLALDISDDQQDITRGKGMVDTLFQAPMGSGTHHAVMTSYNYISLGLRQ